MQLRRDVLVEAEQVSQAVAALHVDQPTLVLLITRSNSAFLIFDMKFKYAPSPENGVSAAL